MEWNIKAINEYIRTEAKESNSLEFKRAASLYNSMNKAGSKSDDLSKDVSAMANSNGGIIIYGIQEFNSGSNKCKAECIDYVDSNKVSEEWIEQVINSRITPRIDNVEIIKVDFSDTECVFVLDIPKSNTAHQAQDKKYYKRYNFQAIAMDDWEVKDVINRASKPKINIVLSAYPESVLLNSIKTNNFEISLMIHNLGMVSANYINCFIEIDKEAKRYIRTPEPTIYQDYIQVIFSNREEQQFKVGEQSVTLPGFYDPLLPLVYKTLGKIRVSKRFFENEFNIKCKVATESTFVEFDFKSNEIEIMKN
ncbi:ATP-binding protein [uncultured Tenacibaculum sp.]|uniref:AlbA family DNA-binding domain-containing protein n=1 Tax=uncultured Tenacibaculum sp. TaxID=174713 RepID=UPI00260672BE|nr:ATP-binding protein [uncultured Tenacibaculum sp.]